MCLLFVVCVRGKRLAPILQGGKASLPRPPPVTQPTRPGSSGDQFILKRRRYRRRLDSGRGGQRRASTLLLDPPVGVCAALTNARCRFCAAVYGDAFGWREVALTSVASQSISQPSEGAFSQMCHTCTFRGKLCSGGLVVWGKHCYIVGLQLSPTISRKWA